MNLSKLIEQKKKEKAKKLRDRGKDVNEPLFNFPEQEANHHD